MEWIWAYLDKKLADARFAGGVSCIWDDVELSLGPCLRCRSVRRSCGVHPMIEESHLLQGKRSRRLGPSSDRLTTRG